MATEPTSGTVLNGKKLEDPVIDQHFDKKMLTFFFTMVLACIMAIFYLPAIENSSVQSTVITVLTGALTTILGAVIGLTQQNRQQQRTTDVQSTTTNGKDVTTETTVKDSDK